jgi:orotate phosphoribosyltransferase
VQDTIDAVQKAGGVPVGVAVMVDRSAGKVRFGRLPFFAATEVEMQTFEADACPLCVQGVPLKVT